MKKTTLSSGTFQGSFFRRALLPGGGMVLVLVACLTLLFPRIGAIKSAAVENKKLIEKKNDFLQKAQLIASLDEGKLRENGALATMAIPKEKEITLILYAISDPARRNNFYTDKLEFNLGEVSATDEEKAEREIGQTGKEKKGGLIEKIPVKMTLIGPGENLLSLIQGIENTLPLFSLDELEGRYSGGGRATFNFNLSLFLSNELPAYSPDKITLADLSLSPAEEELLSRLRNFSPSTSMATPIDEQGSGFFGRENPFTLGR